MAEDQSALGTLTHVSCVTGVDVDVDVVSLSKGVAKATLETTASPDAQMLDLLSPSVDLIAVVVTVAAAAVVVKLPDSTLKAVKVCVLVLSVTIVEEPDTSVDPGLR